jgi:hypothetical protein
MSATWMGFSSDSLMASFGIPNRFAISVGFGGMKNPALWWGRYKT